VSESSADRIIHEQVHAEQIRTLYAQSAPVLLANVINSVIVSAALWSYVPHSWLSGWVGAMTIMALTRIAMRKRYWSRERTLEEQVVWGRRFTIGSLCAGMLWGVAGGVLMPNALAQQVIVLLVLGGMGAGAAASISVFLPAFFAYLIPSLVPAAFRLWSFGSHEHIAMFAMLAMFCGALSLVARNVNRALAQAFRLRFANAELLQQVSQAQSSLLVANENLLRSNEQLETRVRERTEELQASREQLSEIVSESPDAIVVFDERGRLLSVNPAAERIFGKPASALLGKHMMSTDALEPDELERAVSEFTRTLRGEQLPASEFCVLRPNGETVMIESKMRVVRGRGDEQRVHAVLRDVSDRHRMQRLKEAYEARLREAERLESIGMLAGGVAHDFNNVLTTILANTDLIDRWADDPGVKTRLAEIRHGSNQAANLTKQLLAFSRRQVLDVQPTDLSQVVSNARLVFERALGEQNRLAITLPSEPAVVLVDATQIEQAILNLLMNAKHAMPQGGQVGLEITRLSLGADASWPDVEAGSYVRVAVSDTGVGMDEATRRRVFEPFFTTRELGHGTGLGLSSVHGLIKQAGGYIRVISEPGAGSCFEILLPCHASVASTTAPRDATQWSPGSGVVLLVEDQPEVRHSIERILEDAGYQVLAAADGEQALEITRKRDGRIDLLVTDVIMPGISGIDLSRRLLAVYPHLGVLLVSGYAGTEVTFLSEFGENALFLQKPFDAASLTSAAATALQRARAALRQERAATLIN
jgi:PAS domain S-box-containing protein